MADAPRPPRAGFRLLKAEDPGPDHEIRPAFLDPPVALARSALALLGIPPGVAVFTADVDVSPDAKIASLCLEARAVEAEGPARRIYPEVGRRCPAPAPRLWVRGEDIALSRFAVIMRSAVASRRHPDRRASALS